MEISPATPEVSSAPALPEDAELNKVWQEYLQKCCEVGQIRYQLGQIDGQKSQMEKQLEVTERAAKSAAAKHKELQQKSLSKLKPSAEAPALEMKPESSH